jgi:predicted transcriptional regulator
MTLTPTRITPAPTPGVGADIRRRRENLRISRQALAVRAACSMPYLATIESGATPGRSEVMPRLLAALDELEAEREAAA